MGMQYLLILAISLITVASSADTKESAGSISPLDVGDKIPHVSLQDADGETVDLKEVIRMQPTVMIFYRGSWCPYCNRHLAALAEIEESLKAAGYQILAISPDKPMGLKEAAEKNQLGYSLLSDSTAEAIEAFGLGFRVDKATRERYKGYNIDLAAASGHEHFVLPVPAVYLVDPNGTIVYRYYNPDYKVRLSPKDILTAAKEHAPEPVEQ
jgi:peroxiredoxin